MKVPAAEINIEATHTLNELLALLSLFDQKQINIVPFEGSWTAGMLAQHIIMSVSGFVELLNGAVEETNRQPDEKVANIKEVFLNFNIKLKSPDFIVPAAISYNKDELLDILESIKTNLSNAIQSLDLTKTCVAFELPVMGYLTRLEAIYFTIYHTQRHIHQLKNIHKEIILNHKLLKI
jgi:hypothetical protein